MKCLKYLLPLVLLTCSCFADPIQDGDDSVIAQKNASVGETVTFRVANVEVGVGTTATVTKANLTGLIDGDIILSFLTWDDYTTTLSSGATNHIQFEYSDGNSVKTYGYYRIASSEPATWTWILSDNTGFVVHTIVIQKSGGTWVVPTTAGYHSNNTADSTTVTTNSVTGVANSVLLCGFGHDQADSVATPPAGPMTLAPSLQVDGDVTQVAYYQQVGAGAITKTIVWNISDDITSIAVIVGVY